MSPSATVAPTEVTVSAPQGAVGKPPTWLVWSAIALGLWNIGMAVAGGLSTGISWDERVHGLMFQAWLDTGKYWLPDFGDAPMRFIYGPMGDLVGHAFAMAAREEGIRSVGYTAGAFAARHIATVAISVVGATAVVLTVRVLVRSWRWALIAGATLTSIPMWTGHAMFNMKDVTVATGYSWVTLGLVLLCSVGLSSRPDLRSCAAVGALILGGLLAMGTRTAMWLPLSISVFFMLFLTLVITGRTYSWGRAGRDFLTRLAAVVVATGVTYLLLVTLYGEVWRVPFNGVATAVTQSADFELSKAPTPPTYIPDWLGHQLPLLLMLFGVMGVVLALVIPIRVFWSGQVRLASVDTLWPSILLAVQLLLMPLAAIALKSPLYDGVRHFLLMLPVLASLAVLSMSVVMAWGIARGRYPSLLVGATIILALAAPTIEQSRLFPYNYTYFNVVASLQGVNGNWPTDYWRTSWRELAGLIPDNNLAVCPPRMVFKDDIAPNWPMVDTYSCRFEYMVSPFLSDQQAGGAADRSDEDYWMLRENFSGYYIPSNCVVYDEVTRQLRGERVMMSYLLKCRYAPGEPVG